jgi:hypothetical protein
MLYAAQWCHVPPGASASSQNSAKLWVPTGTSLQSSGGEISSPSQVKRRGIAEPSAKELDLNRMIGLHSVVCKQ